MCELGGNFCCPKQEKEHFLPLDQTGEGAFSTLGSDRSSDLACPLPWMLRCRICSKKEKIWGTQEYPECLNCPKSDLCDAPLGWELLHVDLLHINQGNCDELAHPWFIPLF